MATKLNEMSIQILDAKRAKFKDGSNFSIGLLGDSHIGESKCPTSWYKELLKKLRNKKVYAIIHGGDCCHYAGTGLLKKFKSITVSILKYNDATIKIENKVPIIANVGNHDYKLGKKPATGVSLKEYHTLIGKDHEVIKFFGAVKGPRIAVVQINTGYTNQGSLPGNGFRDELDALAKKMSDILAKDNNARFIIDMHIPPMIHANAHFNSSHVLSAPYTDLFRKFMRKHPNSVLAIIAHHKHGVVQTAAYHFNFNVTKIKKDGSKVTTHYSKPVYLTAQGGHCDRSATAPKNPQYSFYIMDFTMSGSKYKISGVSRYNLKKQANGTYVLSKPIPIKK